MAITGPSGSGKTTLLHRLSGLKSLQSGRVCILNQDMSQLTEDEVRRLRTHHMGFMYQNPCLLKDFTACENIALAASIGGFSYLEAQKRALACMASLHIDHLAEQMPATLSGGEKQRVAIARAIINQPDILFADEPTGNLDEQNTQNVVDTIQILQEKSDMAIIMATHDMHIVQRFDTRIQLGMQSTKQ